MGQNVQKVYTISIQMDAAQQKLADAIKKLQTLDQQLEGLDRDSEAGKKLVEQMGAAAAEVEKLQGQVGGLAGELDALKPGTIGALRQEFKDLAAELNTVAEGSAEANRILVRMGEVKGEIKGLKDEVKALDPEKRIAAFSNFASGVVGAFGVATVAAESFGLSSAKAEEFTKKTQGVIAVLSGLEAIRNSLDGETLKSIKSTLKLADAYIFSGTAAEGASKTTKAALLSTGILAIVVLVGLLVANFDKLKEVGSSIAAKFKPEFEAVGKLIDALAAQARNLGSLLTFGLIDDAAKHAEKVSAEFRQKELTKIVEHTQRIIELQKARGQDTLALEVDNAKRRLATLKQTNDEEKKAYVEAKQAYLVLAAQYEKQLADDTRAARLAHLNALAAAETARGADSFKQQVAAKREQIAQLNQMEQEGARITQAQRIQLDNELATLTLAHDKELADKRRALQLARLAAQASDTQGELLLAAARGQDQYQLQVKQNAQQVALAEQNVRDLEAAAQRDEAAITAARAAASQARLQQLVLAATHAQAIEKDYQDILQARRDAAHEVELAKEKEYQTRLNQAQAAGARITKQVADELAAELQLKAMKAAADADIGGNLLIRLFGLTDAQAQQTKQRLSDAMQAVGGLASAYLAAESTAIDKEVSDTQAKLQLLTQQYDAAQQKIASDENAIANSVGARRDYLIEKVNQERKAEQELAGQKAKAAREAEAAQKKRAQLDKEQQAISAASTVIESVLLAVKSAQAIAEAGKDGKFGIDNILYAVTMTAALTTGFLAVKSAAKSFANGTGALGSDGVLAGPAHSQGGIGLYSRYGQFWGEAEGGEAITPVDATRKNAAVLALIRTKGRTKQLTPADFADIANTQVLPPPSGTYASGTGSLGSALYSRGATSGGPGQVVVAEADLSALVANTAGMLAHLQKVVASNEQIAAYGPAMLNIGPYEATKIAEQKQQAEQAQGHATL